MREHDPTTLICLCVDDFGLHPGVNDAAAQLASMGRVHAISCLVGAPAWQAGTHLLRRLDAQGLDVGLHLDLTEYPLLPLSRKPIRSLIAASFMRRLDRRSIRTEIRLQLDILEAAIGHGPAYVDGHQHVHQLPVVREELVSELRARYGSHTPWLRSTRRAPHLQARSMHSAARFKAASIEWLGASGLSAMARHRGIRQNHSLLGVYDFKGGSERYRALLRAWLCAARNADLLMCHPGIRVRHSDALDAARGSEFEVLSSSYFDELLQAGGIALWPMSRIIELDRLQRAGTTQYQPSQQGALDRTHQPSVTR